MTDSDFAILLSRLDMTTVRAETRGAMLCILTGWPAAANDAGVLTLPGGLEIPVLPGAVFPPGSDSCGDPPQRALVPDAHSYALPRRNIGPVPLERGGRPALLCLESFPHVTSERPDTAPTVDEDARYSACGDLPITVRATCSRGAH